MLVSLQRAPIPDAAYWPGRRVPAAAGPSCGRHFRSVRSLLHRFGLESRHACDLRLERLVDQHRAGLKRESQERGHRTTQARRTKVEDEWPRPIGPAHLSPINFRGALRFSVARVCRFAGAAARPGRKSRSPAMKVARRPEPAPMQRPRAKFFRLVAALRPAPPRCRATVASTAQWDDRWPASA